MKSFKFLLLASILIESPSILWADVTCLCYHSGSNGWMVTEWTGGSDCTTLPAQPSHGDRTKCIAAGIWANLPGFSRAPWPPVASDDGTGADDYQFDNGAVECGTSGTNPDCSVASTSGGGPGGK